MYIKQHEMQKFLRDAYETLELLENQNALIDKNDDYGNDLSSVQHLQLKQHEYERNLEALGERVRELNDVTQCLINTHPDEAEHINKKLITIHEAFTELTSKAVARKAKLLNANNYQKFVTDYKDLQSGIKQMISHVSSNETAIDVPGSISSPISYHVSFIFYKIRNIIHELVFDLSRNTNLFP
jgi:spectrin alpha